MFVSNNMLHGKQQKNVELLNTSTDNVNIVMLSRGVRWILGLTTEPRVQYRQIQAFNANFIEHEKYGDLRGKWAVK